MCGTPCTPADCSYTAPAPTTARKTKTSYTSCARGSEPPRSTRRPPRHGTFAPHSTPTCPPTGSCPTTPAAKGFSWPCCANRGTKRSANATNGCSAPPVKGAKARIRARAHMDRRTRRLHLRHRRHHGHRTAFGLCHRPRLLRHPLRSRASRHTGGHPQRS